MSILEVLRIFGGCVFVLFLPGLAWSFVFFAWKKIDWIERIALSFGLSIALTPIAVFWLNWLFELKLTLLNVSLVVCGLLVIPVAYIYIRKSCRIMDFVHRLRSLFIRNTED